MANVNISTNMNLPVPVVGVESGPGWATDINSCLTIIDQHNHTPGYGVQLTPLSLDINSDLTFQNNNLTNARSLRLYPQGSNLAGASDVGCLYESGVDLYYNDANGNQVRITQSGAVAGTPGSISNLVSPASAAYVSANQTFVWQSDVNTPANLDAASLILRNLSANSKGLTLNPPNSMAADYSVTLPSLPASTLPVSISASGTMSAAQITLAQLITSIQQALNPAGSILAYGGVSAPSGYLLCDGTAVSRSTYSALFSAISTAYGNGDGSTTFNLPDLRGQFLRGVTGASANDPDASSRTANNSGGNTGNNVGSQEADAFASHIHRASAANSSTAVSLNSINGTAFLGTNTSPFYLTAGGSSGALSSLLEPTGGSETRPKNVYVNFVIKT